MELEKRNPVIFIVSGKANSGKDTICEMIHNYVKLKDLRVVNLQIASYIKMYAKTISGWTGSEETKPRELLQELGTSIIRRKIDNDFFIKRIVDDIKVYSYYFDVITISDARLPEEIDTIQSSFDKTYSVRIIRPGFVNNLSSKQKEHITEVALDNYDNYDYTIINDQSFEELDVKVRTMVDEVLE